MQKDYIIFNQRLAGYLMQKGFVLKRLKKSNNGDSKRNIFIFNESIELLKNIDEYKNQIN